MQLLFLSRLSTLFKRLALIYGLYFISRVLFFVFNYISFEEVSVGEFIAIQFYSLRFDTFSILVSNSLFILLSLLPINSYTKPWYQTLLVWIYGVFNSLFILFNLIDIAYFPFIKKRSTADLLMQASGQTDIVTLLPQYVLDYWYLLLFGIALFYLVFKIYKKVKPTTEPYLYSKKSTSVLIGLTLICYSLVVLGIRGGFQRIPIDVVDAAKYTQPQNISLILNSPFTIIKSLEKDELKKLNFNFTHPISQIYQPVKKFNADSLQKLNVIIISLESFSKEYTKLSGLTSYTPFLDSLMTKSLVFTNAFSNGHKSIEGIPSILSSLPTLMENPVINSAYAGNMFTSLAILLKKEGYATAFFHGGINGTMNFDSYAKQAGYDMYFGKNEYNNDADFDNFWGIWDEEFLKFSSQEMSKLKQPFHASIFTLSSHHPYKIPEKYKHKFPKGTLENHESIGYADYALKLFFNEAEKTTWFKNTLFVLTADHCSISNHPFYSNSIGQFAIPIIFYKPDNSLQNTNTSPFQQVDIMPSVLDLLGYSKPFFCFGYSFKSEPKHFVNYYSNSTNYMINDSLVFQFIDADLQAVFNYKNDSLLQSNIMTPNSFENEKTYYRAFKQTYNNSLIDNTCQAK